MIFLKDATIFEAYAEENCENLANRAKLATANPLEMVT
jgi:hypothetical protein